MILNWTFFSSGSRNATRNCGRWRAVLPELAISPFIIRPSAVRAGAMWWGSSPPLGVERMREIGHRHDSEHSGRYDREPPIRACRHR
jgi:hypothetical protein